MDNLKTAKPPIGLGYAGRGGGIPKMKFYPSHHSHDWLTE
jgi:hypothetical protein